MKKSSPRQFGPTQSDIARALNLSQASVAIALDPKRRHQLLPATVERVQAKAKELHYRPQRVARILRNGRSHTVGAVFVQGSYQISREKVLHLARGAMKAGFQLVAVDLDWFDDDLAMAQDYLLGAAVEGVILCNLRAIDQHWVELLMERHIPMIGLSSLGLRGIEHIHHDTRGAFRELTEHHLSLGSRKIDFLLGFHDADFKGPAHNAIMERVAGFREAIEAHGGTVSIDKEARHLFPAHRQGRRKRDAVHGSILYPNRTASMQCAFDVGYGQVEAYLESRSLPDSMIGSNDEIAGGALGACLAHGIAVPQQMRISGMDDNLFGRYGGIPLTTIRQPIAEMAQCSITRIIERIESRKEASAPFQEIFLPCELVIRRSTDASLTGLQERLIPLPPPPSP